MSRDERAARTPLPRRLQDVGRGDAGAAGAMAPPAPREGLYRQPQEADRHRRLARRRGAGRAKAGHGGRRDDGVPRCSRQQQRRAEISDGGRLVARNRALLVGADILACGTRCSRAIVDAVMVIDVGGVRGGAGLDKRHRLGVRRMAGLTRGTALQHACIRPARNQGEEPDDQKHPQHEDPVSGSTQCVHGRLESRRSTRAQSPLHRTAVPSAAHDLRQGLCVRLAHGAGGSDDGHAGRRDRRFPFDLPHGPAFDIRFISSCLARTSAGQRDLIHDSTATISPSLSTPT
jgi:hypothetical protein